MSKTFQTTLDPHNVMAVILGGGRGSRLYPLTKDRAKPAVPLAGKYRIVDIPISNCLNSGYRRIYLLTQFNSASLHRHISQSYKFDHFSNSFVEILAAEQTMGDESWYQGTADAVRKNLTHFLNSPFDFALVLSGDQLYRMDYRRLIAQHCQNQADVTVATLPVQRKDVPAFGIMRMADDYRITAFVEKPKEKRIQDEFLLEKKWYPKLNIEGDEELFLASMGIYVFTPQALFEMLDNNWHDFGKDIIPASLKPYRICAYIFKGAWEDIGTIRAYFDCNLDLTSVQPRFNFYDMTAPVFTRARFLPASKINAGAIEHSLISEGCTVNRAAVSESLLGIRSMVGEGARLHRTIVMGADFFETESSVREHQTIGLPPMGIGRNTRIENAIVDKNARIGENCIISAEGKDKDLDHDLYCVRDGIVVIPKNGVVPNGTVI